MKNAAPMQQHYDTSSVFVAVIGRPNVGKSSLLNQLAREERAVVNDLAGTTRDPVDEIVNIDGEDWLFIDTAGIKRRQHKLTGAEYYSSLRTQAAIERCELALILFDASQPVSDQDLKVMSTAVDAGRAIVLVFNKWDAMDEFDDEIAVGFSGNGYLSFWTRCRRAAEALPNGLKYAAGGRCVITDTFTGEEKIWRVGL